MSRYGTYDLKYGFIPDEDCSQETTKPSNADRIRAMTDEELAEWNSDKGCPPGAGTKELCFNPETGENSFYPELCKRCWLDWLKEKVDDDNHDH